MDQRLVVGVGNIYASEALFRARLSPSGRRVAHAGRGGAARGVRARGARRGHRCRGSSLRDYVQASGELGNFQRAFRVYDRAGEACVGCGAEVRRIVQGARATYFCGSCQA
jgi:formamidopyrimidine-DNA glycosylase